MFLQSSAKESGVLKLLQTPQPWNQQWRAKHSSQDQRDYQAQLSSVQKVWLNAHVDIYVAWVCLRAGYALLARPQFWLTRGLGYETVLCDTYVTWIAQNVVSLQEIAYGAA